MTFCMGFSSSAWSSQSGACNMISITVLRSTTVLLCSVHVLFPVLQQLLVHPEVALREAASLFRQGEALLSKYQAGPQCDRTSSLLISAILGKTSRGAERWQQCEPRSETSLPCQIRPFPFVAAVPRGNGDMDSQFQAWDASIAACGSFHGCRRLPAFSHELPDPSMRAS